jgi:integrase
MATHSLTGREKARLKQMNRQLYPAKLRVLKSGAFQFDYRRDGKTVRKVVGHALDDAYDRALIMRKELDDLPVVSRRDIRLEEWYAEYSEPRYPNLSRSTVRGYKQNWNATPLELKTTRINNLTKEKIESELSSIQSDAVRGHTGRFLSILLGAAEKAGLITKSPWHKGYRSPKRDVPMIGEKGLVKLIEAAPTVQPILALAGFCGLRRGEIFALTPSEFGPDPRNPEWVDIKKARIKGYGKEKYDLIKSTKTGHRRMVPIPSAALKYLIPLLETASGNSEDLLFPTFRTDIAHRMAKACIDAGLPKLTLHDLRHLCGSHLMQDSGPAAAQAVLGHQQISTTVDVYGHLSPLYLKRQMEAGSIRQDAVKVAEAAQFLIGHEDSSVAEFARSVVELCQRL